MSWFGKKERQSQDFPRRLPTHMFFCAATISSFSANLLLVKQMAAAQRNIALGGQSSGEVLALPLILPPGKNQTASKHWHNVIWHNTIFWVECIFDTFIQYNYGTNSFWSKLLLIVLRLWQPINCYTFSGLVDQILILNIWDTSALRWMKCGNNLRWYIGLVQITLIHLLSSPEMYPNSHSMYQWGHLSLIADSKSP